MTTALFLTGCTAVFLTVAGLIADFIANNFMW